MKSSFLKNLGLAGITSYPFGKEAKDLKDGEKTPLGTAWADQTTAQKAVTVVTLPFRAVKRIVVKHTAISTGVTVGAVVGGVAGSYMGYMGWLFAGSVLGGLVIGGLIGWGTALLFSSKKSAKKAPVSTTASAIDPATGSTVASTPAPVSAQVVTPAAA